MTKRVTGIRSDRLRRIYSEAVRQGWLARHDGRGHVRLTSPTGAFFVITTTGGVGSLGHDYQNTRAQAKRAGLDVRRL